MLLTQECSDANELACLCGGQLVVSECREHQSTILGKCMARDEGYYPRWMHRQIVYHTQEVASARLGWGFLGAKDFPIECKSRHKVCCPSPFAVEILKACIVIERDTGSLHHLVVQL